MNLTLSGPAIGQEQAAGLTTLDASLREVEGYAAAQAAEAERLTDALAVSERRFEEQSRVAEAAAQNVQDNQVFECFRTTLFALVIDLEPFSDLSSDP